MRLYKNYSLFNFNAMLSLCRSNCAIRNKKIIIGESKNFQGAKDFLNSQGVEIIDLESPECFSLMSDFIKNNSKLWYEDIGKK